jgi:hypothetical protein
MKKLKQYIKEEIKRLQEREYDVPPEILDTLKNRLKMDPLIRYIDYFKAVNSIPPSYRAFLHNGSFFDVIYEDFSLLIKIGSKEYYINDIDEKNYAIKHINKILTGPNMEPGEPDEEGEGEGAKGGGAKGGAPSMPPLPKITPPTPPPPAEEPDEPEEPEV